MKSCCLLFLKGYSAGLFIEQIIVKNEVTSHIYRWKRTLIFIDFSLYIVSFIFSLLGVRSAIALRRGQQMNPLTNVRHFTETKFLRVHYSL